MWMLFWKGLGIGLLFGVPAGAVGVLTVERTLRCGRTAGLVTGLGSSLADCCYAGIGACSLTLVSDFLLERQLLIRSAGAILILFMGVSIILRKEQPVQDAEVKPARFLLTSFGIGITNPAAILTFLLAFSWFGIPARTPAAGRVLLVAGVFCGTYVWWLLLTAFTLFCKHRAKRVSMKTVNYISGSLLLLIGGLIAMAG